MAVRVLIVDDSLFFRNRLAEIIARDPQLEVIGTAQNGEQAITQVKRLRPDVITMDLEMPIMDGIQATRRIMADCPTPILMLSTWTSSGAQSTLDALEAGAVDFLPKQLEDIAADTAIAQQKICQRILTIATSSQVKHQPVQSHSLVRSQHKNLTDQYKIVAIGTSTGGPVALQKVLTQLPATFPYPIVVIQHMPATFTPSFASRLNDQCAMHIKQAEDGEQLLSGTAYLAPGGQQMLVKGTRNKLFIEIQHGQANQTYKPCIDLTFESINKTCPSETLAIILTGMGVDGREGCRALRQSGATIWSQDERSSTIYGMPMAIAKAGLADKIYNLDDIGHHLAEMN